MREAREDLGVVPRCRVAEHDAPDLWNFQSRSQRPCGQFCSMLHSELLGVPADPVAKLRWHRGQVGAGHLHQHHAIAVSSDESDGNIERQEVVERLAWHRAGKRVAADDYLIDSLVTNVA